MPLNTCIVVYSHTEFSDILRIQTDKLKDIECKKILFINKSDASYPKYDQVCYYDDSLQYASKLKSCLDQIEEDKFIFVHDNDIIVNVDCDFLNSLLEVMDEFDINKIDLKNSPYDKDSSITTVKGVDIFEQRDTNQYIYNVNPSIWRKEYLDKVVTMFPDATYRNIESPPTQHFCRNFKFAILKTPEPLKCGYFECNEFFKFLHITHGRVLLRLNEQYVNSQGQSYIDMKDDYKSMVDDYNLRESYMWDPFSNG